MPDNPTHPLDTFKDIDGQYSSKRVAAFIALGLVVAGFFAIMLGRTVPLHLMDALLMFSGSCLGLGLGERFAPR